LKAIFEYLDLPTIIIGDGKALREVFIYNDQKNDYFLCAFLHINFLRENR
jgi:hypothetical protein